MMDVLNQLTLPLLQPLESERAGGLREMEKAAQGALDEGAREAPQDSPKTAQGLAR